VAKHGVTITDFESACFNNPLFYRESYKHRVVLLGQYALDRVIVVVLRAVPNQPDGDYSGFSARPASRKERQFYASTRQDAETDS
jgi:uncharacterized DUF497 family protein